jgi:predicted glycosyltransferase
MNREAALLRTETYSIFTGKRSYLDEYLQELGRLRFIESQDDIKKSKLRKKKQNVFTHSIKI